MALIGSEENEELDVGEWKIKERSMGRVHAVTNAEEVVEEMRKAGLEGSRWQEVTQDEDNKRMAARASRTKRGNGGSK